MLDTAIALDAMAGYEPGDHHWLAPPAVPYAAIAQGAVAPDSAVAQHAAAADTAVAQDPAGRVRIRIALDAPFGVPVDDEPRAAAGKAAALLGELGHDVTEGAPSWDDEGFPANWSTFVTGSMQHIIRVLERLHGRPLDPDGLEPATRAWIVDSPPIALVDYLEAHEYLGAFSRRLLASWPQDSVLLTPTLTRLPAPAGGIVAKAGVTDDALRFIVLVRTWNVTGQPAISLPLHQTDDGLPVGVQLVAPPGREDLLIVLAAQLEAANGGWLPRRAAVSPEPSLRQRSRGRGPAGAPSGTS